MTRSDISDRPKEPIQRSETDDPFELAAQLGIDVRLCSDFDVQHAALVFSPAGQVIFINANLPEQMQRMVCAHELEHVLLDTGDGQREEGNGE